MEKFARYGITGKTLELRHGMRSGHGKAPPQRGFPSASVWQTAYTGMLAFRRRRLPKAISPPQAVIKPGKPAPTTGPAPDSSINGQSIYSVNPSNAALTLLSTYSGGLGPVLQAPTPSGERYGEKRRVPHIRSSQQQKGGV
jgi:hypothetical protein